MCSATPNALLMDLGNVLIKVDTAPMEASLAKSGAVITPEGRKEFYRLAHEYECGRTGTEDFLREACSLAGFPWPEGREKLVTAWQLIIAPGGEIAVTLDACKELKKQGLRLVIFSNTNELHMNHAKKIYPDLFSLFDDLVFSYEVGGAKPDAPMYKYAMDILGLVPGKTLYFDDKRENIESGLRFGFRSFEFDYKNPRTFLDALPDEWNIG